MAYSGIHFAPTCHYRWKCRGMVWRKSMASQDLTQEVHIRHSFDCHHTNIDNHIPIKYKLNRIFVN